MKKINTQKGITLIILIVTIIILLILGVVTIGTVKEEKIMNYTQEAVDSYNESETAKKEALDDYVLMTKTSKHRIGAVKNLKGEKLQVGDFIRYNDGDSTGLYVVLYNDDVEGLQIVSTAVKDDVELKGIDDYANRIQILNGACSKYINKSWGAIDARVLGYTFNDLNSLNVYQKKFELENGEFKIIRQYTKANDQEQINAKLVLQKILINEIETLNKNFWWAIQTNDGREYQVQSIDVSIFDFRPVTLAIYSNKNMDNNHGGKNAILPIILLDQRIKIISGDGKTVDSAYQYEF